MRRCSKVYFFFVSKKKFVFSVARILRPAGGLLVGCMFKYVPCFVSRVVVDPNNWVGRLSWSGHGKCQARQYQDKNN
jgi:hypothetical protein